MRHLGLLLCLTSLTAPPLSAAPAPLERRGRESSGEKRKRELAGCVRRLAELGVKWLLEDSGGSPTVRFGAQNSNVLLVGGQPVIGGDLLAMWLQADLIFPFGWAIAGLIVCSAIGIGFGFYPAYRAASLDPIHALRYE